MGEDGAHILQPPQEILHAAAGLGFTSTTLQARGRDALETRVTRAYQEFVAPGEFSFMLRDNAARLGNVVKFNWEMVRAGGGEATGRRPGDPLARRGWPYQDRLPVHRELTRRPGAPPAPPAGNGPASPCTPSHGRSCPWPVRVRSRAYSWVGRHDSAETAVTLPVICLAGHARPCQPHVVVAEFGATRTASSASPASAGGSAT